MKKEDKKFWTILIIAVLLYLLFMNGGFGGVQESVEGMLQDNEVIIDSPNQDYGLLNPPTVIILDDRIYFEKREYNADALIEELIELDFYMPITLVDKNALNFTFTNFETKLTNANIDYNIKEDYS